MPEITVLGIEAVADTGAELLFEYCHQQISVSVFPTARSSSYARSRRKRRVENRLADLLIRAPTTRNHDEYDEIVENALSVILNAGKTVFDELRRNPPRIPARCSRSSSRYAEPLYFRLVTLHGGPSLVPIESKGAYIDSEPNEYEGFEAKSGVDDDYSRYSSPDGRAEEIPLKGGGTAWCIMPEDEISSFEDYHGLRDHDEEFYDTGLTWEEVGDVMFDSEAESSVVGSDRGWEEALDEDLVDSVIGSGLKSDRIVELSDDEYDVFR